MLRVVEPTDQRIYFELDRFERCDDARVAVTGRWYGVRGRRFVRPTLSLRTDRGRCRALADLEHKPWAAEDGQPWRADFRLEEAASSELLEAELAVAPDIEITLPVDGAQGGERIAAGGRDAPARMPARGRSEIDRLRDELAHARAQVERLNAELRDVARERDAAADAQAAERDAATKAVAAERDAAIKAVAAERERAAAERDNVAAERDEALAERDRIHSAHEQLQAELQRAHVEVDRTRAERDQALAAYEQAVAVREQARTERDQAQALLDRLRAERDWAQRAATEAAQLRDAVLGDLDAAHAARAEAIAERDALSRRLTTLQNEHDQLSSAHGAALVMHNSTRVGRPGLGWLPRMAAAVGLIAVALAVLVLAHVL